MLEQINFPESYEGKRDKAIIQMFYNTGMRLSELIALKIDDVNFSQKYVKVFGKRSKERIIPLLDSHIIDLKVFLDLRLKEFKALIIYFLQPLVRYYIQNLFIEW